MGKKIRRKTDQKNRTVENHRLNESHRMPESRNRLPICALILCGLLAGCGIVGSTKPILQTEIRYPTIPQSFQKPCQITPTPQNDEILISEGLALSQQLRKDSCVCALSYGDLIYLTSGGKIRLDKPSDAECPGLSELPIP